MGGRSYESPATVRQKAYAWDLLRSREVPDDLRDRVLAAGNELTDGQCREFIPLLQMCRRNWSGIRINVSDGTFWEDGGVDYSPYDEEWRDHPDAVFGDPYEHGSH